MGAVLIQLRNHIGVVRWVNVAFVARRCQGNQRGGHDNITVVLIAAPRTGKSANKKKGFLDWLLGEE